jgi:hypothetical protein
MKARVSDSPSGANVCDTLLAAARIIQGMSKNTP